MGVFLFEKKVKEEMKDMIIRSPPKVWFNLEKIKNQRSIENEQ